MKISGSRKGFFGSLEGGVLRRAPLEGFRFSMENCVEGGHDGSEGRNKAMVIINHANKFLKRFYGGRHRKILDSSNLGGKRANASRRDMVPQKIDLRGTKYTFVMTEDKASGLKTVEDDS